jgi:hypothetical protein
MSKPKPPREPTSHPDPSAAPDSALADIRREQAMIRAELILRREYRYLQSMRANLAELPPVPGSPPQESPLSPSNDD